jgi:parallel beta-helix repeat protein
MKAHVNYLLFLSFSLVFYNSLSAKTLYVADNGSNTGGLTWETAFTTIQAAVNAAVAGSASDPNAVTIIVGSSGTGHGSGIYIENISVSLAHLTIESESGPLQTFIQAKSNSTHVVSITGNFVTFRGFSIYGATSNNTAAIALIGVNSCTIENNRCGWDSTNKNYRGIFLTGGANNTLQKNLCFYNTNAGIYLTGTTGNRILSNDVSFSGQSGITVQVGSTRNLLFNNILEANHIHGIEIDDSDLNTLQSNTCLSHQDYAAISLSNAKYHVISQNLCTSNSRGLELISAANYNTITGNYFENNALYGIELRSSRNQFIGNIIRGNNTYGIYCYESEQNTLTRNQFDDNTATAFLYYRMAGGENWHSQTPFTYLYSDAVFSSKMGNYYSPYDGSDLDGNGIGDTPFLLSALFQDSFPLVDSGANYKVQAWYPASEGLMTMEPNQPGQWQTIPAGGSVIFLSDTPALGEINFDVLSSEDGWNGQILFNTTVSGSTFQIQIGYADAAEGLFVAGGPSAKLSGSANFFQFKTSGAAFAVPAGNFLAVQITNSSSAGRQMYVGGGWTYITPPAGAWEAWPGTPPPPANPADLNDDGWVNIKDLAFLSLQWGMDNCGAENQYCQTADIDHSGTVGLGDLRLLTIFWLMGPDDLLGGDFNSDFRVNLDDWVWLSSQWTGDLNQLIPLCENWLKGVF